MRWIKYTFILFINIICCFSCSYYYPPNLDYNYHDFIAIAHRGYWNTPGSVDNSIRSLIEADRIHIDGLEIDVCCTADDSIMVIHGPNHADMVIADTPFSELRKIPLDNGEVVPTLEEYLNAFDSLKTSMVILIEIKQKGIEKEVVDIVKNHGIENQTIYTSFSLASCKNVLKYDSIAYVGNLRGELSPSELHSYGIKGLFYSINILHSHQQWIKEAHDLGMKVLVGASSERELRWAVDSEIDYISTDNPEWLLDFKRQNQ